MIQSGSESLRFNGKRLNERTKLVYRRAVEEFSAANGLSADEALDQIRGEPGKLEEFFIKWLDAYENRAYKTVKTAMAGIRYWLRFNGHFDKIHGVIPYWVACLEAFKLRFRSDDLPKIQLEKEHPLTREQLSEVFIRADTKARALIGVLATSGCRIGAAQKLKWSDIDDLNPERPAYMVRFVKKRVIGAGSKTYPGFITKEVRDVLLKLKREDPYFRANGPVFTSEGQQPFGKGKKRNEGGPYSHVGIGALFRRAVKTIQAKETYESKAKDGSRVVRHSVTAHVLRKWVRDRLAESGIDSAVAKTLLGQSLDQRDMDRVYLSKLRDTEYLRKHHVKAVEQLAIVETHPSERIERIEKIEMESRNLQEEVDRSIEEVANLRENGVRKDEDIQALRKQLKEQKEIHERELENARAEQLKMLVRYSPGILEDVEKLRQVAEDLGITEEEIKEMLPGKMPLMMYKDPVGRTMPQAKYKALRSLVLEKLGLEKEASSIAI